MPSNHSTYPAPTTNADDDWNAGESLTTVAGWVEVVRLAGAAVGDTVSSGLGCNFHGFGLVLDTAGQVGVHVYHAISYRYRSASDKGKHRPWLGAADAMIARATNAMTVEADENFIVDDFWIHKGNCWWIP